MAFYRRRLPHWFPDHSILFVTWRLAGSPPPSTPEFLTAANTGRSRDGPLWLQDTRIATMVEEALRYGATERQWYNLYAWVIMPNHVHVVWQPHIPMPVVMRWVKGRTGRAANQILGRVGQAFWQEESYDHWIRSPQELREIIRYVEGNPVRAGLARADGEWAWSSARARAEGERRLSVTG